MKTIAHISDLHFGTVDPAIAEGLVADLSQQKPDLVVASGDFTQRARAGQYREAAAFLARLPSPQMVVPGNHDVPLWDLLFMRRMVSPFGRFKKYMSAKLMPVYRDEELLVVGVNTATRLAMSLNGFWKDGRISGRQLEEIRARFQQAPAGAFKVLVTHHPFIPPPTELEKTVVHGGPQALPVLEASGVDLLLAGHLHRAYSGDVRSHYEATRPSILSVQAGTATSTRRRAEPNAYNIITIDPAGGNPSVNVAVRTWTGDRFSLTVTTRYVKRGGVWTVE